MSCRVRNGARRIDAARRVDDGPASWGRWSVRIDHEPMDFVALDRLAATAWPELPDDAVYLELAMRRSLTLVSLDRTTGRLQPGASAHPVLTALAG